MISYAGVNLGDSDFSPVGAWVAHNIRPETLFPLAAKFWPGSINDTPIFEQTAWPYRPVTIGTLYWPWSASRFAHGHFVVDDARLKQIRTAAYSTTGKPSVQVFKMNDGTGQIVSTKLWMLPALPLATAAEAAGIGGSLWLLTLVDDRYWWWDTFLDYTVTAGTTAWTDLYNAVGTALDVTITADAIPSAYGTPTVDYSTTDRPVPPYLDAIAFSVGQRIVRALDGTVKAQNYATAAANSVKQAALFREYAGGALALTPG